MRHGVNRREFIGTMALGAAVAGATRIAVAETSPKGRRNMTEVDFIDGRWITHSYFLERKVARPSRVSREPVIAPMGAHGSVVPTADGLAMWYSTVRCVPFQWWEEAWGQVLLDSNPVPRGPATHAVPFTHHSRYGDASGRPSPGGRPSKQIVEHN
jgi:hypothetical protein